MEIQQADGKAGTEASQMRKRHGSRQRSRSRRPRSHSRQHLDSGSRRGSEQAVIATKLRAHSAQGYPVRISKRRVRHDRVPDISASVVDIDRHRDTTGAGERTERVIGSILHRIRLRAGRRKRERRGVARVQADVEREVR